MGAAALGPAVRPVQEEPLQHLVDPVDGEVLGDRPDRLPRGQLGNNSTTDSHVPVPVALSP